MLSPFLLSALDSSRAAALDESVHFFNREAIKIPWNGMLEARCRYGKFQSVLMGRAVQQPVNQTRGKRIATAYAVHDMGDFVVLRQQEILAVVQAR